MIGKIYFSITPFYDIAAGKQKFKSRPVLIIGGPRNNDYTVLPVSTITNKVNLDATYDYKIDPAQYPNSNLTKISYVRVHKQTTVHQAQIINCVCDLRKEYEDVYLDILTLLEQYNKELSTNALV